MNNQELKDLLILLRDYMVEHKDECSGICVAVMFMYRDASIIRRQSIALSKYLKDNLPRRRYALWIDHELSGKYLIGTGLDFCWKPFSQKPRLNWLDKQIKKLES